MKNDEKEINKIYQKMAHTYYESRKSGTIHNTYIANPALRKLVGNVKGKKMLDVGCGFGEDLKYFQKRGAEVYGIELNLELINIMKNDPELKKIPFTQGSVYSLKIKRKFDVCIANLVLDQVKDLERAFKEIHRILKKGGRFIFSIAHPLNSATSNFYEPLTDYFTKRKGYFKPSAMKEKIPYYFRNFEDYSRAIHKAGFLIKRISEPKPIPEAKKHVPIDRYEKFSKLPDILVMELIK